MHEIPAVLRTYIAGLKAHDVDAIADTVSADLAFVTPTRKLDKGQFLQMLRALYAGFPDWHHDHDEPDWRGDVIVVCWRQGGTHTGTFALTEGIGCVDDLPQPKVTQRSRNYHSRTCPRCGNRAGRRGSARRTLHDLGNVLDGRPVDLIINYSKHKCPHGHLRFTADRTDLALPQ